MRIIAGSCRGRRLSPPPDKQIRPTSDRVKEALFSIIESRIGSFEKCKILDICAGTGSLGIEALSRGANCACFIDMSKIASVIIRKNLNLCSFSPRARVVVKNAVSALEELAAESNSFDIVFFDPPYSSELYEIIPEMLTKSGLISNFGILAVEYDSKKALSEKFDSCSLVTSRKYGDTSLAVYQLKSDCV